MVPGTSPVSDCCSGEISFKPLRSLALFLEWKGRKSQLEWFYNDCDCFSCYKSITLSFHEATALACESSHLFEVLRDVLKCFVNAGAVTQQRW